VCQKNRHTVNVEEMLCIWLNKNNRKSERKCNLFVTQTKFFLDIVLADCNVTDD
jgi:hypothetical protein